jgi:hypothetical protein
LYQPVLPLFERDEARETGRVEECVPDLRTEGRGSCEREQRHRRHGSGKAAPAPAYRQHERDHQPELRLVGQKPEQDAGKERPAIELTSAPPMSAAVRNPFWP